MLAAIGEAHSAFNAVEILKGKGHQACFMDLTGFDDDETWTIDERIHRSFQDVDPAKQVVVVTGYTKGSEGIMREFDRGYSEVTFSKVAVELDADEAIIHKEFHLSSADPEIVGAREHRARSARPTTTSPTSSPTSGWRRSTRRRRSRSRWRGSRSASRTPSSRTTPARSSPRPTSASRRGSR